MKALLYVTAILGLVAWAILGAPRTPTSAMPTFAQAYGVDCGTCHTFVPALNAYGRYIQRTAYSTLNPDAMKRVIPVWIGWNTSYDTQDPASPHQVKAGNVALHAAGTFGSASDFTYHAHQWVVQAEQPGGVDTLWVTYNNLLHRNGHLFVGKIESPGPSPFSQWFDVSSFATPALTVGEHTWQNDANRWGAKFAYVHNVVNVEFGYLGSDQDLNGVTDFIAQNGKTFQWRVAYAQPTKPVEIGLYGNVGTLPLAEGGVDRYSSVAAYGQVDPNHALPGLLAIYQRGKDANPGNGLGAATSKAYSVELYEPVFRDRVLVGFRREMTDDGLGTITHTGNVNLTFRINRFLRLYSEAGLAQNSGPAWRWFVWWTPTIFNAH